MLINNLMFFNALIKRYPNFSEDLRFKKFCDAFLPYQDGVPAEKTFSFNKTSQWRSTLQKFGFNASGVPKVQSVLTPVEQKIHDDMVKLIHDLAFDTPHDCFLTQIITMLPGCDVGKHRDSRQFFTFTHRFNLIVESNPDSVVSVFYLKNNKETEVKLFEPAGTLYELNNRIPHSAKNYGQTKFTVAVFDFINHDFPKFTLPDWEVFTEKQCNIDHTTVINLA